MTRSRYSQRREYKLIHVYIRWKVITLRATGRVSAKLQLPAAVSPGRVRMDVGYTMRDRCRSFLLDHGPHTYIPGKHPACSRPDRFKVFINDAQRRRVADIFYCSFRNERLPKKYSPERKEKELARSQRRFASAALFLREKTMRRLFSEMDRKTRTRWINFRNAAGSAPARLKFSR